MISVEVLPSRSSNFNFVPFFDNPGLILKLFLQVGVLRGGRDVPREGGRGDAEGQCDRPHQGEFHSAVQFCRSREINIPTEEYISLMRTCSETRATLTFVYGRLGAVREGGRQSVKLMQFTA